MLGENELILTQTIVFFVFFYVIIAVQQIIIFKQCFLIQTVLILTSK